MPTTYAQRKYRMNKILKSLDSSLKGGWSIVNKQHTQYSSSFSVELRAKPSCKTFKGLQVIVGSNSVWYFAYHFKDNKWIQDLKLVSPLDEDWISQEIKEWFILNLDYFS